MMSFGSYNEYGVDKSCQVKQIVNIFECHDLEITSDLLLKITQIIYNYQDVQSITQEVMEKLGNLDILKTKE